MGTPTNERIKQMDDSYATLTAHAGGGQALATPIAATYARFSVVAAAGDSSILPVAVPGLRYHVKNAGANPMNIFPQSTPNPQILGLTDTINGAAANVAFSLPAGRAAIFFCAAPTFWEVVLQSTT
jgi:hypothetical protein